MKSYEHRFLVRASLSEVLDFHRDPRALRKLTPPPVIVRFQRIEPLAEDSTAEFTMWLGPIPVRWKALHTQVTEDGFTDEQIDGPFESWIHRHQFIRLESNVVEVVDTIRAIPGKRFWNRIISNLMWLNLPVLFAFRGWVTRKSLEGER